MLKFHEQSLKQELDQLPRRSRVAFAASCAQRLVSVYHSFAAKSGQAGRANLVEHAMDYIWAHILAVPEKETAVRQLANVMALLPDEDAPGWTPLTAYAENALSAMAYCLQCLQSGDAQDATWAARHVYDALDQLVTSRDKISPSEPGAEARILCDIAIQAELERQARDIADLSAAGDFLSPELLDSLRRRSAAEQAIVLAS